MRTILRNILTALILLLIVTAGSARGGAAESGEVMKDVLVFKDGDRLQGRMIKKTKETIVFLSDRFGEMNVPVGNAVVIQAERLAEAPEAKASLVSPASSKPAELAEATESNESAKTSRWENFSPVVLAANLREFFGPWRGRLAFSTEVVSDSAERSAASVEAQLRRKWKSDEVKVTSRYDYSETNDKTTTDIVKADGSWRHDFTQNRFFQYRPTLEWNRASFTKGVPSDYVLVQQEIGVGVNLLTKPARKLRLGISENLFNNWTLASPGSHRSRTSESVFMETELRLPGGLLLTDRGAYYFSLATNTEGWENRAEVTKKFTETLSTAIRHEVRQGNPDGRAQDYTKLKLLVGLDF